MAPASLGGLGGMTFGRPVAIKSFIVRNGEIGLWHVIIGPTGLVGGRARPGC